MFKEISKVNWPTLKQLRKDVGAVLSTSLFFLLFFAVIDYLVQTGLTFLIK